MRATRLDPEEYAYGGFRKALALCSDGIVRTIRVGLPDTFFSIPGRTTVRGKTVTGYVGSEDGIYFFQAFKYGKNHAMLPDLKPSEFPGISDGTAE